MKKTYYILILSLSLLTFNTIKAQINLVPNPSFEEDTACPNNLNQINKLKNWYTCNGTPDYFNKCYNGSFNYTAIPSNSFGYQNIPLDCHSYIGLLTAWPFSNINEITTTKLNDSLVKNQKYFFSMNVNLSNTKWASNNLGVRLNYRAPVITTTNSPDNKSNINFTQIITDTLNWTKLFKSFVPDSNYKFISIGNFQDSSLTSKITINPSGYIGSYYFIDDICLSTDSAFAYNYNFNCGSVSLKDISIKNQIKIYPNPTSSLLFIEESFGNLKYTITDLTGTELTSNNISSDKFTIDVTNLPNGFYFLNIDNKIRKKIIIQKP